VDLIYTRDRLSSRYTRELKGLRTEQIVETSDVAVFQEMGGRQRVLKMLGVPDDRPIVGFSGG
jgi:hypothetical protein